jgi:hypothetical protein
MSNRSMLLASEGIKDVIEGVFFNAEPSSFKA